MGKRRNWKFLILEILICLFPSLTLSARSTHGEPCSPFNRCDTSSSLSCHNGICLCLKPESMVWDKDRGRCVSLAGEKCKFAVAEDYTYDYRWVEEVPCVVHATCETRTGICICDPSYVETSNGTCSPRKEFGSPCITSEECRSDMNLKCVDKQCKCDPEVSSYDAGYRHCVGLVGKPCIQERCTGNAMCRGYYGEHGIDSYGDYEGDEDTRCVCPKGFVPSSGGLCQVPFNGTCNSSQCLKPFKCMDGRCTCPYPEHQIYDETTQGCFSLLGGPCNNDTTNTTIKCLDPLLCTPQGKFRHVCTCPEGMVENGGRLCELGYGKSCTTTPDTSKCDQLAPLYCIEGKCQCKDELKIYDHVGKRCRGLVGSECEDDNFCVLNSKCEPFRGNNDRKIGICTCKWQQEETKDSTCVNYKGE